MDSLLDLVIVANQPQDHAAASTLASLLNLPLVDDASDQWQLRVDGQQRQLVRPDGIHLSIDFIHGKAAQHSKEPDIRKQPLAKALGIASFEKATGHAPKVLDATAGLAQDAWLMAHLGCDVQLVEQSAILVEMINAALTVALDHSQYSSTAKRLSVQHGDSTSFMNNRPAHFDVVYLDPMYPARRKSAKVKKAMQFLHELIGVQKNEADLLANALLCATHRVVVKRPSGAEALPLNQITQVQMTTIDAPNTRYDVYHL